jgi:signal transduction histidine kinase
MHREIRLSQMTQRIVTMVRQSLKNDSLSIEIEDSGEIPDFTGDETQLEQVLLNLLLNAQNAMPNGGHVLIRIYYDRDEALVQMEVSDNGPGIPEELQKKIFQPFFTTRTEGIGLGLATCLKNIQYHGGTIEVDSEPGHGTRFRITLPLLSRI